MYSRHDSIIGRALSLYGEFAEDENVLMSRLIEAGDVVVDVGANIGTVTLCLAATVGTGGLVYAFEPQREIFHYFCGNVVLNRHRNVMCINSAVGAADGTIEIPPIDYGQPANFGAVSLVGQGPGETEVQTIDGLSLEKCRLIKIDVEGMEFEVLQGAEKTIDRCQPFVYAESKKNDSTPKVIAFFLERHYKLYWHFARFYRENNFRNSKTNVFGNTGDINVICLPPSSSAEIKLPVVRDPEADWKADYTAWMESG